jgi:hypothetical protein
MKNLLIALAVSLTLTSCYRAKHCMVEKVYIGMSSKELFTIMPGDADNWSNIKHQGGYEYSWIYWAPDGMRRTFWVTVKDGKVVSMISV